MVTRSARWRREQRVYTHSLLDFWDGVPGLGRRHVVTLLRLARSVSSGRRKFSCPTSSALGSILRRVPPITTITALGGYRVRILPSFTTITVLPPTTYFTVRNAATATTFTPTGGVYIEPNHRSPLDTQTATDQDNAVALPLPVAVSLNDLAGLVSSGAFTGKYWNAEFPARRYLADVRQHGPDRNQRRLERFSYYYYNNAWRLSGADPSADYGSRHGPFLTVSA